MYSYGMFDMQNYVLVLFMYFDMYRYQRWHQRWLPKYNERPIFSLFFFLLYMVSNRSKCSEFGMQHHFILYIILSFHILFDTNGFIIDDI